MLLVAAAPGGRLVDGDPPSSALIVEIKRAKPREEGEHELPAPLAEPRLDFRVDLASALAYEVKAGEFIQIIDVKGKQCSDFLAFHEHKLQKGVERGIDGVTTRTLMASAVPGPGLFSKYYDLICPARGARARHSWGAMTFRAGLPGQYYETWGIRPLNCTEKFNRIHSLRHCRAQGLGALNFFYTRSSTPTTVTRRAGSLRAHCVGAMGVLGAPPRPSDDSTPNGGRSTHTRPVSRPRRFSTPRSPRYPGGRDSADKETAFHPAERAQRARRVPRYWRRLFQKEGAHRRNWACREKPYEDCPTAQGEVSVRTPSCLSSRRSRALRRWRSRQVAYTRSAPRWAAYRDATVFASGRNPASSVARVRGVWLKERAGARAHVFVKPSPTSCPRRRRARQREIFRRGLDAPTQTPLEDLKWFRFSVGRSAAYDGIQIVGLAPLHGELGYEASATPGRSGVGGIWEAGRRTAQAAGLEASTPSASRRLLRGLRVRCQVDPSRPASALREARVRGRFVGGGVIERSAHPQRRGRIEPKETRSPARARSTTGAGESAGSIGHEQPGTAQEHRAVPDVHAVLRAGHARGGGKIDGRRSGSPPRWCAPFSIRTNQAALVSGRSPAEFDYDQRSGRGSAPAPSMTIRSGTGRGAARPCGRPERTLGSRHGVTVITQPSGEPVHGMTPAFMSSP